MRERRGSEQSAERCSATSAHRDETTMHPEGGLHAKESREWTVYLWLIIQLARD